MIAAIAILLIYAFALWLVFFKFKWIKFSIAWGVFSTFFGLHVLLIFMIGLRFMTPYSKEAKVIQHTIQLTPRLSEPTLVTEVLVSPNVPVKKGQPLFRFDRRPYEYKVRQLEAQVAYAKQNVQVLKADEQVAADNLTKAKSELVFAQYQQRQYQSLAKSGAANEEFAQKYDANLTTMEAAVQGATSELNRARLKYTSQIGGVNTTVAALQAELDQARFFLDNTTMVAPEDGHIINLQVRPGMVAGDYRIGAIASFICDSDRYLLATYFQENLKYVKSGQPVEIAMDLYPGQIFKGRVDSIWMASGEGQMLPTGTLPAFSTPPPQQPQGRFAVKILFDEKDVARFPIGAQGAAAIYTTGGGFAALRKIGIRTYSWLNWLYPMPF